MKAVMQDKGPRTGVFDRPLGVTVMGLGALLGAAFLLGYAGLVVGSRSEGMIPYLVCGALVLSITGNGLLRLCGWARKVVLVGGGMSLGLVLLGAIMLGPWWFAVLTGLALVGLLIYFNQLVVRIAFVGNDD